jgi:hypothetical protein
MERIVLAHNFCWKVLHPLELGRENIKIPQVSFFFVFLETHCIFKACNQSALRYTGCFAARSL